MTNIALTVTNTEAVLRRVGDDTIIQNLGPDVVYVGLSAGVTAANGLALDPVAKITLPAATIGTIHLVSAGTSDVRCAGGVVLN